MSKASLQTFTEPRNEVKRLRQIDIIYKMFNDTNDKYTIRQAATALNMSYNAVQKRISDLQKSDLLKVVDIVTENGHPNSVYMVNRNPQLFKAKKVSTKFELLEKAIFDVLKLKEGNEVITQFKKLYQIQLENTQKKKCSNCKKMKAVSEFAKGGSTKSKRQSYCKDCNNDYQKEYRNS